MPFNNNLPPGVSSADIDNQFSDKSCEEKLWQDGMLMRQYFSDLRNNRTKYHDFKTWLAHYSERHDSNWCP
jgi:hypothetical protein